MHIYVFLFFHKPSDTDIGAQEALCERGESPGMSRKGLVRNLGYLDTHEDELNLLIWE